MLENQAFGWLKTAITLGGGSENHTAIESCTDISLLVGGVSSDFEAIRSAAASASSEPSSNNADIESKDTNSITTHRQDITTRLDRIKTLLYDERSASSSAYASRGCPNYNWIPAVATSTFKCFTNDDSNNNSSSSNSNNLIAELIRSLTLLPFEARKSIAAIFNYLLVCGLDGADARQFKSISLAFGGYVHQRADVILTSLVKAHYECEGSSSVDVTLLCGAMLRSCLRHVELYQWMLADSQCEEMVYPFLERCVHNPNFDVSSDALETVRVMLTGSSSSAVDGASSSNVNNNNDEAGSASTEEEEYKQTIESIASEFLNRKYDDVIDIRMNACLAAQSNYMTRRMTLQLLSTILLNRSNYNVMIRYISSSSNLVTILNLLRDPSPHITLDAFQVFKIFVANPSKPPEVVKILVDNKVKLIKYLEGLHKERERSDEQFRDEKGLVVGTLEDLVLEDTTNSSTTT